MASQPNAKKVLLVGVKPLTGEVISGLGSRFSFFFFF